MQRLLIACGVTLTAMPVLAATTDSYTALSHALVRAIWPNELVGTNKITPKDYNDFTKCFKTQGLTKDDLKKELEGAAKDDSRVEHCLNKLIGK